MPGEEGSYKMHTQELENLLPPEIAGLPNLYREALFVHPSSVTPQWSFYKDKACEKETLFTQRLQEQA